ncbi:zinc finger, CCHC-type containing protein [Tanacetum coccineum]|uniref:Zinc finger, CCHC-type containing protein n=1 Tax=Tanacetum coccineum TaxID=301880 RepID=A0ABQ5DXF7_9ASTR
MITNFGKLDKFEGHDFRRWQKKMHFLLTTLKVVYVLTTPMPELLEDATVEAIRRRAKWENDDYICRGHILNGMSDSLFDVYTNVESAKELWDSLESKYMAEDSSSKKFLVNDLSLVQLGSHLRIEESLRAHDSDKGKGKEVGGPSVNMTEEGKNKHNKQNKGKKRSNENNSGSSSNKKPKLECWKCGKTGHFKRDCRSGKKNNANAGGSGKGSKDQSQDQGQNLVDAIAWWIDSGATTHVCKDRCWFKTFEPVEDGSVLYMGDEHFAPIHGKGSVALEFSSGKIVTLFNVLYVPNFGFGYYNNGMFMLNLNKVPDDSDSVYMSSSTVVNSTLWHARLGHVHYKRMLEMSKDDLIPAIDENLKKSPYTTTDKWCVLKENRALKEMVNSMLSYSGLSEGFWGEAMLTACYLLNRVPNKRNKTTPYELWFDCIFVGYAEHSKAYRFYVIEPNDSVSINSIIESRDAIFDENRFSSIPRPKDIIPNLEESQRDDHSDDVPSETPEPRRGKRAKKVKSYGSDFQLYLVEGSRDQVGSQYSYCYSIEEDPRTYNEAVQSRDAAFWKEAIDDEIGSIMEINYMGSIDLPTGFRHKGRIDYFDTYAPVARITTIRLLLALAAIHNLVIHQMDVKTAFLNGDLDEEVYMKQPEGFVMPGNEHKVCKLVKSLYGLKQAPKQCFKKFDEVVLSSGFHLNQSDKCVYSKFDNSGKGVIICLYVDDMLIFGTDQNQVDKTKKFLSSRFSMKDMGEADIILGIKIKRENKGIVITQSHYIEKILKKFNREDCSPVSTPMDPVEKLKPNTGKPVDQLEYSRAIGCLMYAMTSTRPDIAYAVGRLMLEGYSDASWINHVEDSSSTSGWVFLLGGALAAAGKEAEWLRNLINEIPIWPKPIAPISIRCDSAPRYRLGMILEIGTQVSTSRGARSKGTTYVNMKFSRFKKLGDLAFYSSSMDWDTWLVKLTVRFFKSTTKTSSCLNEDRYGVEELQSTLYHLLREHFAPIPKGNGILTFPHLSLHPVLAYFGTATVVVVNERKISRTKRSRYD